MAFSPTTGSDIQGMRVNAAVVESARRYRGIYTEWGFSLEEESVARVIGIFG